MSQTASAMWNLKNLAAESRKLSQKLATPSTPAQLSRQWRTGSGDFLGTRRGVVVLSLVAIGAMGLISLYQTGVLKRIPQPKLPGFDADSVNAAPEAYERFAAPDAVLAVGSYAATLGLAAVGSKNRAQEQPWLPLALAAKVGFDASQVFRMLRVHWTKYKAFCLWCLVAAAATLASVPLVWGESREALAELTKSRR